jgi:hypothetical protein
MADCVGEPAIAMGAIRAGAGSRVGALWMGAWLSNRAANRDHCDHFAARRGRQLVVAGCVLDGPSRQEDCFANHGGPFQKMSIKNRRNGSAQLPRPEGLGPRLHCAFEGAAPYGGEIFRL